MKAKKVYSKPQLTQVRLAIQSPVLAVCSSVNPNVSGLTDCNDLGTFCADTNQGGGP